MNGYTVTRTFDCGFAVRLGVSGQIVAILGSEVEVVRYMVAHKKEDRTVNGFQAPTDRYGNQFATRVEVNTGNGVIYADIVQESTGLGWFRVMIGGVILSPLFESKEDAIDAADAILCRLVDGELLVEPMPEEGAEDQAPDFTEDDYPGDVLPTGWDAQDHKALYE